MLLSVLFDEEEGSLQIEVNREEGGRGRYFVPDTSVEIGVGNLGMFANDVAYTSGCTEDEYDDATARMSGKVQHLGNQKKKPRPPHFSMAKTSSPASGLWNQESNLLTPETPNNPNYQCWSLRGAWRTTEVS